MPRHNLMLPDLGINEAPILVSQWLVEPGSRVVAGEPVLEVLAGPAAIDLPAPADGVLVETLLEEDGPLVVGQRLAVIESEDP